MTTDKNAGMDHDDSLYATLRERLQILDVFANLSDAEKSGNVVFHRFRDALDNSRHVLYCMDAKAGRLNYISPFFAAMTGYSLESIMKLDAAGLKALIHEEDRRRILEVVSPLIAGRTGDRLSWNPEYRFRKADGSWLWLNDWSTIWFDEAGKVDYYSGTLHDVTARKIAEENLRISEETLRSVFDAAPFPITVTTPREGEVLYVNKSVYGFYGLDPEKDVVEQLRTTDFYVDPEARKSIVGKLLATGEARDVLIEMRRRDGTTLWTSFSAKLTKFAGRDAIVSAQFDVDERLRAGRRLGESEEKFSKIFLNAPLLIGIADRETGRIVDVNLEFERITGYSRDELIGKTYAEAGLIDPSQRESTLAAIMRKGSVKGLDMEVSLKNGKKLQISYNGELVNIDGKPMILSIVEDVTERRRSQEREIKAQKIESLGVMAGGIAHDFNNILTGILGNISLAKALSRIGPESLERLEECEKACRRAGELSRQLLTFAKGGAPQKAMLNLTPILGEAASFSLHGSNVKYSLTVSIDLCMVEADQGQLSQVFSNLLINAAQAMPSGGEVKLTANNVTLADDNIYMLGAGRYVSVKVEDEGCGIPAADLDRIFDPYFTTKPMGSGLGLSTVYSILRRHGGGIQATSEVGKGSVFTVLLPALECDVLPDTQMETLAYAPRRGIKVLVMDDEHFVRDLVTRTLAHLGYEPVAVIDGAEALVRAKDAADRGTPFDAAILDLTVPGGMGGREAAALLREVSPKTLLVVSSGYSSDPVLSDYRAHGFSGVVAKPYAIPELATELHRLLRS